MIFFFLTETECKRESKTVERREKYICFSEGTAFFMFWILCSTLSMLNYFINNTMARGDCYSWHTDVLFLYFTFANSRIQLLEMGAVERCPETTYRRWRGKTCGKQELLPPRVHLSGIPVLLQSLTFGAGQDMIPEISSEVNRSRRKGHPLQLRKVLPFAPRLPTRVSGSALFRLPRRSPTGETFPRLSLSRPRWPRGPPRHRPAGQPPPSRHHRRTRRSPYLDVRRVLTEHRGHGSAYSLESASDRPSLRPQAPAREPSDSSRSASGK